MKPKRSLGQNFLVNVGIADKIIAFAGLSPKDRVVEIGPGRGVLTKILADSGAGVTAVEKDDQLFAMLSGLFARRSNITIIHGDILECDLSVLIKPGTKIIANLPYNIASQLIIRFADYAGQLSSIVVMVQKEVAQRICAAVGQKEYSALSVLVSSAFEALPGLVVGPNNFVPAPKVTSQVIKLVPRDGLIPEDQRRIFRVVVFQAFSQRRKMLRNSLMGLAHMDKDLIQDIARDAGIDLNKRPQDLCAQDFHRLSISYVRRACLQE